MKDSPEKKLVRLICQFPLDDCNIERRANIHGLLLRHKAHQLCVAAFGTNAATALFSVSVKDTSIMIYKSDQLLLYVHEVMSYPEKMLRKKGLERAIEDVIDMLTGK